MNRSSNTCGSYEDEESIRELANKTNASHNVKNYNQNHIKELCSSNGINYEKLKRGSVKNVKTLEMFFSGYPRICGMEFFPVLQSLTLVGQEIRVLENLSGLVNLVELNVSECMVQKISGVENCTNLKKLFLYDNKIKKIENISNLSKLATLWLNNNYISEIEGLDKLVYLTDLNLADNCISYLGNSLDNNVNLEVLDLSANQLTSFKDLTRLSCLQNLHSLSLKNPVYGSNPLAQLCNYATYLLFHLPDLKRLDTYDVDNKHLKELAEVTVLKKKMYYNMRVKTLQRNTADLQSRLAQERDELQSFANSRIYKLYSNFKEIEREQEDIRTTPAVLDKQEKEEKDEIKDEEKEETKESLLNESTRQCENKKQALLGRIEKWEKQNREIEACYKESCEQVQLVSDMTIQRLIVELETGGNVRFEDGKPTDLWYKSCHDLVTSRFCAGDYMKHGITGIKIHRITRVHNRILRTRFDEALDEKLDNDDIANVTKGRSHKKLLEYLFFVWNPNILDGVNEPIRVLEKGFRKNHEYENAGQDSGVPMSNSIGVGDESRIQHCVKKWKERGSTNPCPFRHGQLIISKVFVGKTVAANVGEKRVTKSKYPGVDSVYRPRSHDDCEAKTILGITRPVKPCDCTSRQCAWFVFDESMVLPEYVVDFEYITKVKSKSQYIHYPVDTIAQQGNEGKDVDDDVLSMEPKPKLRPRMIALTEDLILNHCNADSLQNITVLNLHGNGLTRLKYINTITSLKKLIVSFNEIAKLEEINHMLFLEYIDVSFNKLTTLEGMKGCNRLKYLDISWNKLKFTREELGHMRKHMISLTTLDTRNNPWQKPETLRTRALGRLKNLEILDGKPVTSEEVATSLRMAAASRISTFAILAHSRTDQVKPHSLSLFPTAQTILATSNHKPTRPMDDDNLWMSKVTTLNLDNLHLGKISNLDKLINLRWASLNNNDLTKIEGFDSCSLLQELSLEGNCISKFEGLTKNSKLKWLNLRNNNVSNLDTGMLERLPQLHHLSIENNCIKSLRGLQNSLELQELYIGNNDISNVREIFTLKIISTLVILDLCGNPLVNNTTNYRLFVIYHLTTLKALDGLAVEPSEGGLAKDTFGGRMTTDFIAERLGHSNFMELRELDFPNCSLRTVDLGSGELFLTLRSVNLEQNSLTSFGGLINLVNLKVLCLNHNHIETVVAKSKSFSPANASKQGAVKETDFTNPESYTPVLLNLEVLHLGYNGISSLATLQLSRLPNLKALFLQGNEITKVEGLEGLRELRELVLDRNKIKCLHEYSFVNQWNLVELHMEENRLRSLSYIECLQNLQRLYIGMNRIQDFNELEKLEPLSNLMELSVINNTVTRRLLHRPTLVFRMPGLLCIDGIPVSNEERTKAEVYFLEQQGGMQSNGATESSLPGIPTTTRQTHAPLRVTTMHLSNSTWNAASRQEFVNSYVNGDSRDSNNKGRRAGNNRGAASNSQHNLSSSDSFHSDRRSHSNSNVPTSQTFSRNSGTVSYIPHGFSYPTYPFSNEERNKGNQRHR